MHPDVARHLGHTVSGERDYVQACFRMPRRGVAEGISPPREFDSNSASKISLCFSGSHVTHLLLHKENLCTQRYRPLGERHHQVDERSLRAAKVQSPSSIPKPNIFLAPDHFTFAPRTRTLCWIPFPNVAALAEGAPASVTIFCLCKWARHLICQPNHDID